MRVYVYEEEFGDMTFSTSKYDNKIMGKCLGRIELDIKPLKKITKKDLFFKKTTAGNLLGILNGCLPENLRNAKITYEVEDV